jgi:hypothetical protein
MPNPREHKRFCDNDGWKMYRKTDHYYYRKVLENGEVLKTKISMNAKEYSPTLFAEILKRQLKCTTEYFNGKI